MTCQEKKTLKALYEQGLTDKEIGVAMSYSDQGVKKARLKMGLLKRSVLEQKSRVNLVIDMWNQGKTRTQIAAATGYNNDWVRRIAKAHGLRRPLGWKQEGAHYMPSKETLETELRTHPVAEIARRYGKNRETVRQWIIRHGLQDVPRPRAKKTTSEKKQRRKTDYSQHGWKNQPFIIGRAWDV